MKKRSATEIIFRLKQELGNVSTFLLKPGLPASTDVPRLDLPDAVWAARKVKGTPYAAEIEALADGILGHRVPLLGFGVLDLGPDIDWRRDYIHGKTSAPDYFRFVKYLDFNAVGDHKIIWELNRHQHLVVLAQATEITGNVKYHEELVRQLESWFEQNPYGRGINWASALEVAFRALSWIWIFHIAGKRFSAEFRRRFLIGIHQHGCFLENNLSVYFSPNTHLLGEALTLHAIGALFPQFPKSARWKAIGGDWTRKQMDFQVRPDGSHFEQSSYYQVYATDMFLFHLLLDPDVPLAYKDRLGKMADYVDALLGPQREIPLFGDDDGGRFFSPYGCKTAYGRATLATASVLLERDYGYEEADLFEQGVWWLSPRLLRTLSRERQQSRGRDLQFPDAGVSTGIRNEASIVFKWGGFGYGGAGHSHADVLSLTVRLSDEELLLDPGTYTYMASAQDRDWFRSVSAHNTVRIDGRNQADPETPFRWGNKPQVTSVDPWTAVVTYGGISHRRQVNLSRAGLIVVIDEISGSGLGGESFVEQFWHTGVDVSMLSPACFALGRRARLHLQPGTSRDWEVGGEFGWRSRGYGVREASAVVRASKRGPLPMKLVAVIDLEGKYSDWPAEALGSLL
jgi:hypothetical protein